MVPRPARPWCRAAVLLCSALCWQRALAEAPVLARVGPLSIDVATLSRRAFQLAPFQRARLGAAWPEQRRRLLEQELVPDALLEAEAARGDRQLSSARDRALAQALLMLLRQQVETEGAPREQVAGYYAAHRQSYELPRALLLWRILVGQEVQARELLRELGKPHEALWSRLARERSIDRATHMRAGSLGYVAADGQTHMPQVRVSPALFAAADTVADGEIVPQPIPEGQDFAVVWRRASRAAQPEPLDAVADDIGELLAGSALERESSVLLARLRSDALREHQPELLAGFEPRALELLDSARPGTNPRTRRRPVLLGPRPTDSGLR